VGRRAERREPVSAADERSSVRCPARRAARRRPAGSHPRRQGDSRKRSLSVWMDRVREPRPRLCQPGDRPARSLSRVRGARDEEPTRRTRWGRPVVGRVALATPARRVACRGASARATHSSAPRGKPARDPLRRELRARSPTASPHPPLASGASPHPRIAGIGGSHSRRAGSSRIATAPANRRPRGRADRGLVPPAGSGSIGGRALRGLPARTGGRLAPAK